MSFTAQPGPECEAAGDLVLASAAGGLPPDEMNLLGGPQPCLDHDHLLVQGDDRGVALLPHRDGGLHPVIVEGNALHLDLLGAEGRVDDLLVLVDDGAYADPTGQPLALADDRPLLNQGNGLAVIVEAVGQLRHRCPIFDHR